MLAIGTAKRAKQLKEGVKPMVKVESDGADYPIDVALKELEAGKVRITVKDKPQDETVVLDEMDQILDKEIAAATHDQEADKKTAVKEKNKPKSKSLAA